MDNDMRVIHDPVEAWAVARDAREAFLASLEPGGLTVTEEAKRRWWPLADSRPAKR